MINDNYDFGDYRPQDNREFEVWIDDTGYIMTEETSPEDNVTVRLFNPINQEVFVLNDVYHISDDFYDNENNTKQMTEQLIIEKFIEKYGYNEY